MATPTLLTKQDVADRLQVCPRTVGTYIGTRQLAVVKLGRAVRISEAALAEFLQQRTQPAVKIWREQR